MKRLDLNQNWQVRHVGDTEAVTVNLPHDAALGEARTPDSLGGVNTGWFEGYDYSYTKTLSVPADWADKAVLLECEGVYRNAEVWLNGKKLAFRPYGYTNFYVDLSRHLRCGEDNALEIIARNADQPNSRWYSGAGLYRPVWLHVADRAGYLPPNAIRVRTAGISPVTLEITVKTVGTGAVTAEVLDGEETLLTLNGSSDGTVSFRTELPNAELWTPEHPKLYACRVTFGADSDTVTFGARILGWSPETGFTLNGERVILRGACDHHTYGILGACCYPDAAERKVRLLLESGYNAIRSAHNPCSKALLEACDRLGMFVMDEYIDHWYIHKTQYDYVDYFTDWWRQDLSDMVDKDYNHPCVILYSTGNEVSETAQPRGIALTKEMTDRLHALDGTRPVTCGVNIFFNFLSSMGFGVYSDDKAKKAVESAEKSKGGKKKEKAVGSQFFNNLAGLLGDEFMKRGATLHGCDVKTRDAFANMDIAGYNYGIYRYPHDLKKYPKRLILGSETFCSDAYAFWELAKREKRMVGDFVWAGHDYLGETMIGAWEYSDYAKNMNGAPGWIAAGSGRLDLTGKPGAEVRYTQVAFEEAQGPYIGVVPVNHSGEKHSPSAWRFSNAIESWSWEGCEGRKAQIEVYARAASVELLLNGKSVGAKQPKNDCIVRFTVPYEPGTLEAVSLNEAGEEIGRKALTSASGAAKLWLLPEEETAREGHLVYIRLRYADENGVWMPQERRRIRVNVTGGRLLALGSGCPYNDDGYLGTDTDTYFGEALAIVLADGSGAVTLDATDGERSAGVSVPLI